MQEKNIRDESRFLALGWHLKELHVNWAHLEKKRARLRTYNKSLEQLCIQREFKEETEKEIKEEEEDSLKHFDTFPTMKELRLGPRRKPSNLGKICNFIGRVKGLKVFVGNFTYECEFMVLEDTTSVIDHDLGLVVFEKPFVKATGLVYDREEGTITFEKYKENIVFKIPHEMEIFKHIDFTDIKTDRIPPFVIESDDYTAKKPTALIA
uniref:Protein kinase-like domain, concanavalin A-like lectin/glucanase domain protein n=1 Tax=Tanacetum cinerariifolium TaxID=118510 RepID=A0A6L2MMM4_TANCI|nr:protein kinase-like domain, concanavalin A-like lectin/glucanase domain protein [Tanacetum cinerariifolium]